MTTLKSVIVQVRDALVNELGERLIAFYLYGSASRGEYVPGRSDVNLLLVINPSVRLATVRKAFRPVWDEYAHVLRTGPLVATPDDLALYLELAPELHHVLLAEARRFYGQPVLEDLPEPPERDPLEPITRMAAKAMVGAAALTPSIYTPERAQRLAFSLERMAHHFEGGGTPESSSPVDVLDAIHARLRELAQEMPEFAWPGEPPAETGPFLLPGCLAFYRRDNSLIAVFPRVDKQKLAVVDWEEVGRAVEDEGAEFALATPWQLRLVASRLWVDSLYFQGFECLWGTPVLDDLKPDEVPLVRRLARVASEQLVKIVPRAYLTIEDAGVSKLIHDTQNVLLNAGLRAELLARFTGRDMHLPHWIPPGQDVPQVERVAAAWQRWRVVTAHFTELWREMVSPPGYEEFANRG